MRLNKPVQAHGTTAWGHYVKCIGSNDLHYNLPRWNMCLVAVVSICVFALLQMRLIIINWIFSEACSGVCICLGFSNLAFNHHCGVCGGGHYCLVRALARSPNGRYRYVQTSGDASASSTTCRWLSYFSG